MKKIISLILISFSLQSQTLIKLKQLENAAAGSVITTTGTGTPTWTNTLPIGVIPTLSYIPISSVSAFQPTVNGGYLSINTATATYVPYTGATTSLNLGLNYLFTPRIVGGTSAGDGLDLYSTSGNGTGSGTAITLRGGNNGSTIILTALNNGNLRIPNNRIIQGTDAGGTNRSLLTWSAGDNIEFNGRPGVTDIVLNPTSSGVGLYVKSNGDIGLGVASPSARAHIIKTTEQLRVGYDVSNYFNSTVGSTGNVAFGFVGTTPEVYFNTTGSTVIGNKAALTTTATTGFLYVPTCAGVPTGVPTSVTGKAPIVIDATNNKMYIYSGGAWVALN